MFLFFQLLTKIRAELHKKNRVIENLRLNNFAMIFHELKINESSEFHEKISEYSIFMSQCLFIFILHSQSYFENKQKILFIISYFRSIACDWAIEILEDENHSYLENFQAFKRVMNSLYIDHNFKYQARNKLLVLK